MQLQIDATLNDLGRLIQMAIAPVFLLSGVASFLNVLNARLARVIDRTRVLDEIATTDELDTAELVVLARRRHWINRAITLCTTCALLTSLVIVLMFLGILVHFEIPKVVAFLFIAAMLALIIGLLCFLREVNMAVRYFRKVVSAD